jgi:hypothetical protein
MGNQTKASPKPICTMINLLLIRSINLNQPFVEFDNWDTTPNFRFYYHIIGFGGPMLWVEYHSSGLQWVAPVNQTYAIYLDRAREILLYRPYHRFCFDPDLSIETLKTPIQMTPYVDTSWYNWLIRHDLWEQRLYRKVEKGKEGCGLRKDL